jgi:hypothetical protein
MEIIIPTDATEPIEVLILDGSLVPITGKSDILISIRRTSDDYYYDFDDDTFKNSGWTTRREAMTEVDSVNDPGVYGYDFDTSAITNKTTDDTYMIRVDQSPGTDAKNLPQGGEIKEGQWVDDTVDGIADLDSDISALQSDITTMQVDVTFIKHIEGGRWKIDEITKQMIFYEDDNVTEVARFNLFTNGVPSVANPDERQRV